MRATTRRSRTAEGRQRHPARRTYHHGDLRRALIDASLGLLEEDGPNGVTLRESARLAAVALWTLAHGVAALAVDRQIPPPLLAAIPLERLTEGLTQMLLDGLVQKDGRAARHHDARP